MERPWPEADRELVRVGSHICEVLPKLHRCVYVGVEGVQLRLFIPEWTTLFCFEGQRLYLENPETLGRVDISALVDRLWRFSPLEPGYIYGFYPEIRITTVDINLRVPVPT